MTENEPKTKEPDKVDTDEKTELKPKAQKKENKRAAESVDEIKTELESKEQEAKENYDRFLRVSAEFENYKKRSARQMEDFKKYANEALMLEILTVVDNLERAIQSSRDDENSNASVVEGVQMTLDEILRILEKFGVKPIDSMEQSFDPNFHQAVMQEETKDYQAQTVIKELQKGYLIHDRLLRPAMVVVSKENND